MSCQKMKKYKLPLSPPQLPPGYLTSIPRRDVYRLMKEVRLDRIASICAHIELIPEGKHTSLLRPPIHIAGGHPSWLLTLHGIRHFYEVLTEKDREAELAKARELPRRKRDLFTRNMKLLMKNRVPTYSSEVFVTDTATDTQNDICCPNCGITPTAIIKSSKAYKSMREQYPSAKCLECVTGLKQTITSLEKRNAMLQIFVSQVAYPRFITSSHVSIMKVDLQSFLRSELGENVAQQIIPRFEDGLEMKIRVIKIPQYMDNNQRKISMQCLNGSHCKVDNLSIHPNVFENNEDVDGTLILLDGDNKNNIDHNFAFLMDANFDKSDTHALAKRLETVFEQNPLNPRIGPASGICQLGDKCTSMSSVVTKKSDTFYSPSSSGVNLIASYVNDNGKLIQECSWGYRDIPVVNVSKSQKQQEATEDPSYRGILIEEALCLIKGLACLLSCGIPPRKGKKYLKELRKILGSTEKVGIDDALVQFMCLSKEVRNYGAVAAHVDKNKNAEYEILTVFSRDGSHSAEAFLYFPLDNFVLRLSPDKTAMLCNFTRCMHVPDPSRDGGDGGNFSRATWTKS